MPPGRGVPRAGFPVRCPFAPLCRAGVHARRTLNIFKNCIGAAGPAPAGAFRTGAAAPFRSATGPQGPALSAEMANRRAAAALRPEIKAPPYNTRQTPYPPRQRPTPAVFRRAACMPPLRMDQTPTQPKRGLVRQPLTAGPRPRPTEQKYTPCQPYPAGRRVLPHRKPNFLCGKRPHATSIFHFYFLIFNFIF